MSLNKCPDKKKSEWMKRAEERIVVLLDEHEKLLTSTLTGVKEYVTATVSTKEEEN